jgi:hypothetical protein
MFNQQWEQVPFVDVTIHVVFEIHIQFEIHPHKCLHISKQWHPFTTDSLMKTAGRTKHVAD